MAMSKWETNVKDKLLLVEAWARNGLTDEQIAKNLGIAYSTFREYKKKYSALSAALKKGKEVVDIEVENALLKRALGYKYKEVTKEKLLQKDSLGNPIVDMNGMPVYKLEVTKEITKEVSPDTTAQIFWLKNRKSEEWRDRKEVDHSGSVNNPYEGLSTEDLKKLIKDG